MSSPSRRSAAGRIGLAARDQARRVPHHGPAGCRRRAAAHEEGNDFSRRFPLAVAAIAALPARSCLIDGEAIVTDQNGLAVFDLIRGHRPSEAAVLCAFDLLELDGEDLRREPIETRKSTLKSLLRGKHAGIAFNAHFGWRDRLPSGLRARLRGHRVEAPGVAVPFWPRRLLAEGQEPGGARGHTKPRSRRPTRPRRSITIRWSRMRLLPRGRAIRSRSIRRVKVWRWRKGVLPDCSAYRPIRFTSAVRFSAAASAPKV